MTTYHYKSNLVMSSQFEISQLEITPLAQLEITPLAQLEITPLVFCISSPCQTKETLTLASPATPCPMPCPGGDGMNGVGDVSIQINGNDSTGINNRSTMNDLFVVFFGHFFVAQRFNFASTVAIERPRIWNTSMRTLTSNRIQECQQVARSY